MREQLSTTNRRREETKWSLSVIVLLEGRVLQDFSPLVFPSNNSGKVLMDTLKGNVLFNTSGLLKRS